MTLASPIIACRPEKFDEEIHNTSYSHWDDDHDDSKPLIYARPVVYRNFHRHVLSKELVGNK